MHITRVIRDATCDAAIYILLTSYLEAARNQPHRQPIPDAVLRLPLQGAHDVEERCRILQRKRSAMSRHAASRQLQERDEALEISGYAAERLQALADESRRRPASAGLRAA